MATRVVGGHAHLRYRSAVGEELAHEPRDVRPLEECVLVRRHADVLHAIRVLLALEPVARRG